MTEQEIKLQCLELAVDIASQSEEPIDINKILDDAESLIDFVNSDTDKQKEHNNRIFNNWFDEVDDNISKAVLTMQLIQDKSHKFKMRLVGNKPLCELDVEITPSGYLKYNGKVADTISAVINIKK